MTRDTSDPQAEYEKKQPGPHQEAPGLVRVNKRKKSFAVLPFEKKKILEQRAQFYALSRQKRDMDDSTEVQDFITFTHAGNKFALEITRILEIQVLKEITFIPNVPAFFAGAVNIRGDILLVINILRFLKLQERGLADMTKIIIVQAGEIKRGILANEVSKMALIKKTDLRPSDGSISEDNQKFILGMTSGLHLILNIETILAEQNMKLLQDSLSHLDGD